MNHSFIGIVALVGQQGIGLEARQQMIRSRRITRLTRRQVELGGIAQGIDRGVNLGAQTALTPPHRFVAAVFLRTRALLMSTNNGTVHDGVFVIGIFR